MPDELLCEPAWLQEARESLEREAAACKERAARKEAGVIARASRQRSPLGRFLRSKAGKRLAAGKRVTRHLSVPIDLDAHLVLEAEDVGLSMSKFIVVLAALGAAQWGLYRGLLFEGAGGEAPVPLPKLVEHILTNAVNPTAPKAAPEPRLSAWRREVHQSILALRKQRDERPQRTDATTAVLRGAGGMP